MFEEAHLFQCQKSEYMFECHTETGISYYLDHRNGASWITEVADDDPEVEFGILEYGYAQAY